MDARHCFDTRMYSSTWAAGAGGGTFAAPLDVGGLGTGAAVAIGVAAVVGAEAGADVEAGTGSGAASATGAATGATAGWGAAGAPPEGSSEASAWSISSSKDASSMMVATSQKKLADTTRDSANRVALCLNTAILFAKNNNYRIFRPIADLRGSTTQSGRNDLHSICGASSWRCSAQPVQRAKAGAGGATQRSDCVY